MPLVSTTSCQASPWGTTYHVVLFTGALYRFRKPLKEAFALWKPIGEITLLS